MADMDPQMRQMLERIMVEMRGMFPSHFRLTLLARNASLTAPDRDIMITEDQLDKAVKALDRIHMESLLTRGGLN
jgi:hypothetical protein